MSMTPGSRESRCRRMNVPNTATSSAHTKSFSLSTHSGTATLPRATPSGEMTAASS